MRSVILVGLLLFFSLVGCSCEPQPHSDPALETAEGPASPAQAQSPADDSFSLTPAPELRFEAGGAARVQGVALSPEGTALVAIGWSGKVVLFDLRTHQGRQLHQLGDGDMFQPGALAWSHGHLAVGTFYNTLLFDSAGSLVHSEETRANRLVFSGDGNVLFRATSEGVDALDPTSAERLAHVDLPNVRGLVLAGDRVVALAPESEAGDNIFVSLNPANLAEVSRLPAQASTLAGEGDHLGTSFLGDATLLNGRIGSPRALATGGVNEPSDFAFGGEHVVARGQDGLGLYSVSTGRLLARVEISTTEGLAMDTDGARIFVGTPTGVALFGVQAPPSAR